MHCYKFISFCTSDLFSAQVSSAHVLFFLKRFSLRVRADTQLLAGTIAYVKFLLTPNCAHGREHVSIGLWGPGVEDCSQKLLLHPLPPCTLDATCAWTVIDMS